MLISIVSRDIKSWGGDCRCWYDLNGGEGGPNFGHLKFPWRRGGSEFWSSEISLGGRGRVGI